MRQNALVCARTTAPFDGRCPSGDWWSTVLIYDSKFGGSPLNGTVRMADQCSRGLHWNSLDLRVLSPPKPVTRPLFPPYIIHIEQLTSDQDSIDTALAEVALPLLYVGGTVETTFKNFFGGK